MRIDLSSRELRDALDPFVHATSDLSTGWDGKTVQLAALRRFIDTVDDLADELAHPEYRHGRAVDLARTMFDAGLALIAIFDEAPDETRAARGAALTFLETIARYLSPFAKIRAA